MFLLDTNYESLKYLRKRKRIHLVLEFVLLRIDNFVLPTICLDGEHVHQRQRENSIVIKYFNQN